MNNNDMLEEIEQLTERPYSRSQRATDQVIGRLKGLFGSGQVEQGAISTGDLANQYWSDFKNYIGKKYGKFPDYIPYSDLSAFFKANGLDTNILGVNPDRRFDKKSVAQQLISAARIDNDELKKYRDENKDKEESDGADNQEDPNENPNNHPYPPTPPRNDQIRNLDSETNKSEFNGVLSTLTPEERKQLLQYLERSK